MQMNSNWSNRPNMTEHLWRFSCEDHEKAPLHWLSHLAESESMKKT